MLQNPYSKSLETRILSATPLELVVILYDEAIEAVRSARKHLATGKILPRSRSVSRAVNILMELSRSLNFEAGGELSKRLAGIYSFMRLSLLEANFRQTDEGLAAAEHLLVSLREAWCIVSGASGATPPSPGSPADDAAFPWGAMGEAIPAARSWNA